MKVIRHFNKVVGLIVFSLISIPSLSQSPTVVKGSVHKISTKEGWSDIDPIGHDATSYYYLLYPFSKVYSGKYIGSKSAFIGKVANTDMKLEKIEKLDLTFDKKSIRVRIWSRNWIDFLPI